MILRGVKMTPVSLLVAHGGHHIAQIDAVVAKDYGTEATVWKNIQKHIYTISDALAGGIENSSRRSSRWLTSQVHHAEGGNGFHFSPLF
jgi:hypothetical protein